MAQFPRLLLAAGPGVNPPSLPVPTSRVRTGACIGADGRLLRAAETGTGDILMVSGGASCPPADADRICLRLVAECRTRSASGIVCNWPSTSAWESLTARLDRTAAQEGLSLWVPEHFAGTAKRARLLISSQLSGGTLSRRLRAVQERWGARVTLMVECTPWQFPLPCPPGQEQTLEPERLRHMLSRRPRVWFSESLCAQYFTCMAEERPRLILFDNAVSVRRKLELAAQCGIAEALLSWEEIRPFSDTLFRKSGAHGG